MSEFMWFDNSFHNHWIIVCPFLSLNILFSKILFFQNTSYNIWTFYAMKMNSFVCLNLQIHWLHSPLCFKTNIPSKHMTIHTNTPRISRALPPVLRYYLKSNLSSEPLIPDDMIGQLLMESQISLLQLSPPEVAWQLTLNDYKVFREVESTEYVDELYGLPSKFGTENLKKFSEVTTTSNFV